MPFNGSGVFQRIHNWVADATAGIKIAANRHDAEDDGFAAGLTNCIAKDGQTIVTQNIPWNSKRITGLEDPINDQDAATKKYADVKFSSGGKMTGDLTIEKDSPMLYLNDTEGDETHPNVGQAGIVGLVDGKKRWLLRVGNDNPETLTDNTGSNFDLHRFANNGDLLSPTTLMFSRATGLGTVGADPTEALGIATKQYTDTRVARAGDTMTGLLTTAPSGNLGSSGGVGTIEVRGPTADWAAMTFHSVNTFAANFGMNIDGNFYMGGYSHGAGVAYRFWTTRDFTALPTLPANVVVNARLAYAGDLAAATGPQSSTYEPYGGGVITGWQWAIVGYSTVTAFRLRYMQIYTTSWFTIGYAS